MIKIREDLKTPKGKVAVEVDPSSVILMSTKDAKALMAEQPGEAPAEETETKE